MLYWINIEEAEVEGNFSSSWFLSCPRFLCVQFLVYVDSIGPDSPMDMETDGLLLDDVGVLKRAVEEEATQVSLTVPDMIYSF